MRTSKLGQKEAAKALMLTWQMVCLKYGAMAGKNFMTIYAKMGAGKAYDYKHLLDESEKDIETLQNLIDITSEKLAQYFGGCDEKISQ